MPVQFELALPCRRHGLVALLAVLTAAVGAADVRLSADLGFDGAFRRGRWTPLRVVLENTGNRARGELTVRWQLDKLANTYHSRVDLPAHSRKAMQVIVWIPGAGTPELVVGFRGPGINTRHSWRPSQPDTTPLIVVVSPDPEALNFLRSFEVLRVGDQTAVEYSQPAVRSFVKSSQVAHCPRDELPERWWGYDSADMVILHDCDLTRWSSAQFEALRGWIQHGGRCLVVAGPDWRTYASQRYELLLPVRVTGSRETSLAPLAARFTSPGLAGQAVAHTGRWQDGEWMAGSDEMPLVAARQVGVGKIYWVATDISREPFRSWPGMGELWAAVTASWRMPRIAMHTAEYNAYDPFADASLGAAVRSAAMIPSMKPPSPELLAAFLFLYLLCLAPINYLVLKKLDRREWAWVTTPGVVIVFTALSYGAGYVMKGGALVVHECRYLRGAAGESTWSADGVAGVFSPQRRSYELAPVDPRVLLGRNRMVSSRTAPYLDVTYRCEQVQSLERVAVNMWDMVIACSHGLVDAGKGIAASYTTQDGWRVKIRNDTPFDISGSALLLGDSVTEVGPLKPGAAKSVRVPVLGATVPDSRTTGHRLSIALGSDGAPAPVASLASPVAFLASSVAPQTASGVRLTDRRTPTLVCRLSGTPASVRMPHYSPQRLQDSLGVIALPVCLPPGRHVVRDAVIHRRLAGVNHQRGQPRLNQRGLQLPPGTSVDIEFTLPPAQGPMRPLAAGWKVQGRDVQLSAFDFTARRWVKIPLRSPLLAIRRPLVSPSGGVIRMRAAAGPRTAAELLNYSVEVRIDVAPMPR